jgi:hypothetical protein
VVVFVVVAAAGVVRGAGAAVNARAVGAMPAASSPQR